MRTLLSISVFLYVGCAASALRYTASEQAEKACIENAEGGVGKAALRAAIDACRNAVKDGSVE